MGTGTHTHTHIEYTMERNKKVGNHLYQGNQGSFLRKKARLKFTPTPPAQAIVFSIVPWE